MGNTFDSGCAFGYLCNSHLLKILFFKHFSFFSKSTGNEMLPFVQELPFAKESRQPRRLLVDDYLRVLGSDCIYAAGDVAAEEVCVERKEF